MKRYASYILILIMLVGLFSPMIEVRAEVPGPGGGTAGEQVVPIELNSKENNNKTGLYDNLTCFSFPEIFNVSECLGQVFYVLLVGIPSLLLGLAGMFFNAMLAFGLSNDMFHAGFVSQAWEIVRNLSNIFFILILLYVAIQTILGLGHESKKVIVHIIIMALLINFSMFFTKVVIDSSNVLALVFYNKITNVGKTIPTTKMDEKDVSSKLAEAFNPSKLLSEDFFNKAKTRTAVTAPDARLAVIPGLGQYYLGWKLIGYLSPSTTIPIELIMGIEVISGAIMLYATYCFFVVGALFLARLIELWILIIFSPFAFMSWSIPKLSGISGIGWESWLERLIKVSFMAPIFMFFLYLIFMLVNANLFVSLMRDSTNPTTWETMMFVIIPALVILIILHKATKWTETVSGEIGGVILKTAKMAGGLAVMATAAAVSGGTSLAVGGLAAKAASSKGLQEAAKATGARGVLGRMALRTADYGSKASFDVRGIPGFGKLAGRAGLDVGKAREGGYEGIKKQIVEKRKKRADELEKKGTKNETKIIEDAEIRLKEKGLEKVKKEIDGVEVELPVKVWIEKAEKKLKEAREDMADASPANKEAAAREVENAKQAVKNIKKEMGMKDAEDAVKKAKSDLEVKASQVRIKFATELENPTGKVKAWRTFKAIATLNYSADAEKEAARKIRMGEKAKEEKHEPEAPKAHAPVHSPTPAAPAHNSGGSGHSGGGSDHGGGSSGHSGH